jgi:uncharacterized protein
MSRPLPLLTHENTAYWTGGARDELMIVRCMACQAMVHPPESICPVCLSRNVAPVPVAGTGTVHSFTINYQNWVPELKVPFALVVVDLDDAPGVRITGQWVGAAPDTITVGQLVQVCFEQIEDVWIPQFKPRLTNALE